MYKQINKDSPRVPELTIDYISGKKFDEVALIKPDNREILSEGLRKPGEGQAVGKQRQIPGATCLKGMD